jgi:SAM-dependent methyltransferase
MAKKKMFDIKSKKGIMLDIGCGEGKEPRCVGMDIRPLPGVDIVHDVEELPYPLPDECCLSILARHIVEHINPAKCLFIKVMDEWWRIMKPYGKLMIVTPYPGSAQWYADPTHCNFVSEMTIAYFAPLHPAGLWAGYSPKPWFVVANAWNVNGNLEVMLAKMPLSDLKNIIEKKEIPDIKKIMQRNKHE